MAAYRYQYLALLFPLAACAAPRPLTRRSVEVCPAYANTSINATIFRKNAIVSHQGFQYVAFYDSNSFVTLAKRRITSAGWQIERSRYQGNTADAHNVISIMVDGDGFLHVAWDHHGNRLRYTKGIASGSIQLGSEQPMTGRQEEHVTYPEFYRFPNGDLLFAYRDGSSGNGNMVLNRYETKTKRWLRLQDNLLAGEGTRNAYWQLCIGGQGSIHVSWVWRENADVQSNHDLGYAVSKDGGHTWLTSGGERYAVPITAARTEYAWRIPEKSDLINQTSITTDAADRPYMATYFQDTSDACPQYYVIYRDDRRWVRSRVTARTQDFDLGGGGTRSIPMSRPQLLFRERRGRPELWMIYRDEEHGDRACLARTPLPALQWRTEEITSHAMDRWEPSYDTEMWKRGVLHVYVQRVGQGSGERGSGLGPQMVSVLEIE